jgi:hypothetical protein
MDKRVPKSADDLRRFKAEVRAQVDAFLDLHRGHDVADPPEEPQDARVPLTITCRTCGESLTLRAGFDPLPH